MEREISSMYLFSNFMTNVLTIVSKMTYNKRVMTGRVEEENERNCAGGGGVLLTLQANRKETQCNRKQQKSENVRH
jgi:hypothetical protein